MGREFCSVRYVSLFVGSQVIGPANGFLRPQQVRFQLGPFSVAMPENRVEVQLGHMKQVANHISVLLRTFFIAEGQLGAKTFFIGMAVDDEYVVHWSAYVFEVLAFYRLGFYPF